MINYIPAVSIGLETVIYHTLFSILNFWSEIFLAKLFFMEINFINCKTYPSKCNSVVFSMFSQLCHYVLSEHLDHPVSINSYSLFPLPHQLPLNN